MSENVKAVVLAAGKGTRLQSEQFNLPKVMRLAAGRPLLSWVLQELDFISPENTVLVVGYMKESVIKAFPGYPSAIQKQQLGTGHAVISAKDAVGSDFDGAVLICCGDMPLMKRSSYQALIKEHFENGNDCTLLSGTSQEYLPYGRIVRKADGSFDCIVEEKDCTQQQRLIRELNAGVYVFNAQKLFLALEQLRCDNAQGEYYLTDAPAFIKAAGGKVGVSCSCTGDEMLGVNTPQQLEQAEALLAK